MAAVALLHLLLLESKVEEDERVFAAMLKALVRDVGPKTRQGPDGSDISNTVVSYSLVGLSVQQPTLHSHPQTGRELVDWLVGNPDKVPAELRRHEPAITEALASQICTKLMHSDWLVDHTSTSFMLFSFTHLYEVREHTEGGSMSIRGTRRVTRGVVRQGSTNNNFVVNLSPPAAVAPSHAAVSANEASRDANVDWLVDCSAADIARALTSLDVDLLKAIDLTELDFQAWKKSSSDKTSTIQEWIALFNRTCYLVSTEIITCPWPGTMRSRCVVDVFFCACVGVSMSVRA